MLIFFFNKPPLFFFRDQPSVSGAEVEEVDFFSLSFSPPFFYKSSLFFVTLFFFRDKPSVLGAKVEEVEGGSSMGVFLPPTPETRSYADVC